MALMNLLIVAQVALAEDGGQKAKAEMILRRHNGLEVKNYSAKMREKMNDVPSLEQILIFKIHLDPNPT